MPKLRPGCHCQVSLKWGDVTRVTSENAVDAVVIVQDGKEVLCFYAMRR